MAKTKTSKKNKAAQTKKSKPAPTKNKKPQLPSNREQASYLVRQVPSVPLLSSLGYVGRPLLRPIKFVRSRETATLFLGVEELLEPTIQNLSECSSILDVCINRESEYSSHAGKATQSHIHAINNVSSTSSNLNSRSSIQSSVTPAALGVVSVHVSQKPAAAQPTPAPVVAPGVTGMVVRTIPEIPNQTLDMISAEQQIRRFIADTDKKEITLPPYDPGMKKKIHTLFQAFRLNSVTIKGTLGWTTTLSKTKGSEKTLKEKKIANVMKEFKQGGATPNGVGKNKSQAKDKPKEKSQAKDKTKGKTDIGHLKAKEGDVVGQVRGLADRTQID